MAFGSKNAAFAVDLGADVVRAVELTPGKSGFSLVTVASRDVGPGLNETLPDRQLAALADLLTTHRVKSRQIIASIPTNMVVTRNVQIDPNKPQSVEEQILKTMQNCLPFDAKDILFDHWQTADAGQGNKRGPDYLVVATQRSVIERYLAGFEKLGFTCVHLDVAPCALATLVQHTAAQPDAVVGTVVLSKNNGFFAIAEKGKVLFWRPFELGSSANQKGVVISGVAADLDRLGEEISKCVSHMVGTMRVDTLGELLLFGHGADDLVVNEYLKNRFHLPVRAPSPFDAAQSSSTDPVALNVATHYGTAMGLAMQQYSETRTWQN